MGAVGGRAPWRAPGRRTGAQARSDREVLRRALRTGAAVTAGPDWVWPHWIERQRDPTSTAFVSDGGLPVLANVTTRSWTVLGNVGSADQATVDRRGLVTPWPDGWSLDWWIGAEDRWHLPSRESAVRQRLVADAPVVETAMRVPGGDIVQRAYAIRSAPRDGGQELVVVEVENATPVPVALAVAVRPYGTEGVVAVERIGMRDGATVTVDGHVALLLPRAPNRVAASTAGGGDVAGTVIGGGAGTSFPAGLRCPDGLATAAFVYPLPHRATMWFLLPLAPPSRRARRAATDGLPPRVPATVPTGAQVANGWKAHAAGGLRLVLPDARLAAAVEANRRYLLVMHDRDLDSSAGRPEGRHTLRDTVAMLGALDRFGDAREVAEVLATFPGRQRGDGSFADPVGGPAANGAALHAVAEHWRLHRDADALEGLGPIVAAGAEWLARTMAGGRAGRRSSGRHGRAPGPGADDLWRVRGLVDAAEVLRAIGEDDAARAALDAAERRRPGLDEALAALAAPVTRDERPPGHAGAERPSAGTRKSRTGRAGAGQLPAGIDGSPSAGQTAPVSSAVPVALDRPIVLDVLASLAACGPSGLVGADDAGVAAIADVVRDRHCLGPAVVQRGLRAGLSSELTLRLASLEVEAGDRRALERIEWSLSVASPTWTWPEVVHPRLDGGSGGDGHHGGTVAALLDLVRDLLVRETADGGLALCSLVPDDWLGQQLEVHDAPTHHGTLSFAVRWHGDRPALLWELEPHDGTTAVRITAPGLDPSWSAAELRGDALLAPVPPPLRAPPPEEDHPTASTPVRLTPRRPGRG